MKILLVEDEIRTAHYLRKGLVESGFAVDVMASSDAQANSHHADYDLLVCDMGAGAGRVPGIRAATSANRPSFSWLTGTTLRTAPPSPATCFISRSPSPTSSLASATC